MLAVCRAQEHAGYRLPSVLPFTKQGSVMNRFASVAIVALVLLALSSLGASTTTPLTPTMTVIPPIALPIQRCITSVHVWKNAQGYWEAEMDCLNPCGSGCEFFITSVPGAGDGSSCKCVGAGVPACCHLVFSLGEEDPPQSFWAEGVGNCNIQCEEAGDCGVNVEILGTNNLELSADCEP